MLLFSLHFLHREMGKSPGLYFDIGKKARGYYHSMTLQFPFLISVWYNTDIFFFHLDVLYKDFAQQPKMYEINYQDSTWSFDLSFKSNFPLNLFSCFFLNFSISFPAQTILLKILDNDNETFSNYEFFFWLLQLWQFKTLSRDSVLSLDSSYPIQAR